MFEDFKKITIEGGFFDAPKTLELFKADPISIVYGRNGSGKTTIARAVRCLAAVVEEGDALENADLIVSSEAEITEEHKKSVFVFDEEFLSNQVRVEKDGLNTIVMLGEQVELDVQINERTTELNGITARWTELTEWRGKYDNAADTASPLFFFNKIRDALRKDGGWADIDRDVKGNQVKSRINEDLVNSLVQTPEPKESAEEIRAQVEADLSLYFQSSNAEAIEWDAIYPKCPDELSAITSLLTQQLESPELTERERRLLRFLQAHPQHFSQEATKELTDSNWEFCPLCLREAKREEFKDIATTLTHILNEEANRFAQLLNGYLMQCEDIAENLPVFPGNLNEKELKNAKVALANLNRDLAEVRGRLEVRKRNIYIPSVEPFAQEWQNAYQNHWKQYVTALKALQDCVMVFNNSVKERGRLYNKIREENNLLARKELTALLQGYRFAIDASNQNRTDLQRKTEEKLGKEQEIKALKAQKERTDIALGYINMELQYVFYSERKVKLIAGDGCYKLVINGRNVRPKKISVGERNVLGLCYFFAMLFSGKRDEDKYASEYLIVIDDPVSSFDYGNRLGVMSLLRYQFNAILKGNANSRILVMSHDLQSVFDMVKIRSDVQGGRTGEKKFLELEDKEMKVQNVQNEYKKLLWHVFDYAQNLGPDDPDDEAEMGVGNLMRRLMEAFASFCYNTSFEQMMCREGVLNKIPAEKKAYYENFMCRLTLNSLSHEEEHVYSLNTIAPYYTKQEKVQTAKSLLLFLLYINEEHLVSYCEKNPAMITTIRGWQAEEAQWIQNT